MAKNTTTAVAGGKGKVASKANGKPAAKGSKAGKGKAKNARKTDFAFRKPNSAPGGGYKAGEFGKVRKADLPPSANKLAVLATLLDGCKGEASPPEIVKASKGKVNGKQARHYCYHAEAGGLVKRNEGDDCTGIARFAITAAGRKAVAEMKKMKF